MEESGKDDHDAGLVDEDDYGVLGVILGWVASLRKWRLVELLIMVSPW
jgi:hypothetical protein